MVLEHAGGAPSQLIANGRLPLVVIGDRRVAVLYNVNRNLEETAARTRTSKSLWFELYDSDMRVRAG